MLLGPASLLLTLHLVTSDRFRYPSTRCDLYYTVRVGKEITVSNPNWPFRYMPGEVCRWTFKCPNENICRLRCFIVLPQSSNASMSATRWQGINKRRGSIASWGNLGYTSKTQIKEKCHVDKLLVSTKGYINLEDADVYCGRTIINSSGSKISMGLISDLDSPGGRFRCRVKAESTLFQ